MSTSSKILEDVEIVSKEVEILSSDSSQSITSSSPSNSTLSSSSPSVKTSHTCLRRMARFLLTISLTISIFLLLIFLVFTVTTAHRISQLPQTSRRDSSDVAFFKAKLGSSNRSPAELGSQQEMLIQDTGQPPGLGDYVPATSWSSSSSEIDEREGRDPRPTSDLLRAPIEFAQEDDSRRLQPVSSIETGQLEENDQKVSQQLPQIRKTITTTTKVYDQLEGEDEVEENQTSKSTTLLSQPFVPTTSTPPHRSRSSAQMKAQHSPSRLESISSEGNLRPNLKELLLKYIEQKAAQTRESLSETATALATIQAAKNRGKSPPEVGSSGFSPRSSSVGTETEDQEEEDVEPLLQPHQPFSPSLSPLPPPAAYQPPVVHRNLTSSSQRIAKNFQDLNAAESGGSRISRYNLPSNSKAEGTENAGASGKTQCGEAVTIDTNYELSSPNYPEKYPPNMDCSWEITATKQKVLRVQIFKLNIEQEQNCRFDYLDVIGVLNTDPKTGAVTKRTKRYCGTYVRQEIAIGANHTAITFHSDGSTEQAGFHIRVIAESQDCLKSVAVFNSSILTSPQYPAPYEDSKNCWTVVSAQLPDHRLLMQFEVLRLEPDVRCALDYVELFDGAAVSDGGKSLGRFCQLPANASLAVYSSGPRMLVHFQSDNFLALLGYKARITALRKDVDLANYASCNWTADFTNMTISSPFYPGRYPPGTRCETSISALVPSERIIILFDWIDLVDEVGGKASSSSGRSGRSRKVGSRSTSGKGSSAYKHNCSADRLEIWESVNDTTPSRVLCGYRSQPLKYISTGNSIRLVFRSAEEDLEEGGSLSSLQEMASSRRRTEAVGVSNPGFMARFTFTSANSIGAPYPSKRPSSGHHPQHQQNNHPQANHHRHPPSASKTTGKPTDDDDENDQQPPPPEPRLLRRPENASVRLGSSHVLHCELEPLVSGIRTSGYQNSADRPPIVWFKGDREIHEGVASDGSSLLIRAFAPTSAGRYICVYGDGDEQSADAWLSVRPEEGEGATCKTAASSVLFRERPKDQFTSEGEFVMLHCSVTLANGNTGESADTEARISWQRMPLHVTLGSDGNPLPATAQPVQYSSRIKVLRRGDLLFDPALVEDSGFYFCVVRPNDQDEVAEDDVDGRSTSDKGTQTVGTQTNDSLASEGLGQLRRMHLESEDDCAIKSAARVQINQRLDVSQFCGRSFLQRPANGGSGEAPRPPSMSDVGKIIGGTEAEPGEFPWMVMFWDEKRHVFCGGALLNERWILTAAHCFTDIADESTVFVKLGKYDQTSAEPTETVTKIAHIIKHPHFSNETFDNDIALVKLVQHITFTDYIAPICLPSAAEEVAAMDAFFFGVVETENGSGGGKDLAVVPINSQQQEAETRFGYVSGWGRLKENGPLPRYLHKIRLPIVEEERCHRSTSFKVTDNMFCAGYGKEIVGDACKGDSGGPFAVQFANRWVLLGIVSWGEGCGRPEKYGYYTRVNNYSKWIRRLTRHNYQL